MQCILIYDPLHRSYSQVRIFSIPGTHPNPPCSSIFLIFKDNWAYLFNSDPAVVELTSYIMPLVALFQVFDGLDVVTGGILRAKGQQTVSAILNLVGYHVVGIPVGLVLAFYADMGIYGLWTGLTIALVIEAGFGVWSKSLVSLLSKEIPDRMINSQSVWPLAGTTRWRKRFRGLDCIRTIIPRYNYIPPHSFASIYLEHLVL